MSTEWPDIVTELELPSAPLESPGERLPPRLESGDRLSRAEFERRYESMVDVKKAELIEGVVYVSSPTRSSHTRCQSAMVSWLACYCARTPGLDINDKARVRLDTDNEVQPDVLLRLEESHGGSSHVSVDDYVEGPPELIVEVALSSASYDLHDKLNVYRRVGVQEYIIWRMRENAVDWLRLLDGVYMRLDKIEGRITSKMFPGLTLNVEALTTGDVTSVVAAQQEALNSKQHRSFVQAIQANARKRTKPDNVH